MINKILTDEEIIKILQQEGNNRYFTLLAERYEVGILKKCMSYVKDKDISEDLCQEILLKVFINLKNFKGSAKFSTWLFSIIHNTCIDHLRKNKKNIKQVITTKMAEEVADIIDSVDEISLELSEKLMIELLENISPEDRLLLLMKYKEKYSIQDIQNSLNLSESAVKMRLKRSRDKLTKLYAESLK